MFNNGLLGNVGNNGREFKVFSTTETLIGVWINGKSVYRKVIDVGSLPNNTTKNVPHGITTIEELVDVYGTEENGGAWRPLPNSSTLALTANIAVAVDATNVIIATGSDRSLETGFVIIEYTKV
jgi:hypothetical protein